MLPQVDGLEICRAVRANAKTAAIPIIMLTARAEESERIVGLELGADDYIAKPFSPNELVARVRALLRRAQRATLPTAAPIGYGPIVVDPERTPSSSGDRAVTLTAKEFLLLEYLLSHRGRVLSRDVLLTDVWGYSYTGGTRTVDVHVRRLREKLPLLGDALVTVKQFGYKLLDPAPLEPRPTTDLTWRLRAFRPSCSSPRCRPRCIALAVAGVLFATSMRRRTDARIEQTLVAEAQARRRAARGQRTSSPPTPPPAVLDAEADRIGQLLGARVTFIAPDGRVRRRFGGDASRRSRRWRITPRVPRSSRRGRSASGGRAGYSATLKIDMLYVAVPVQHPAIAFVRVALPLTDDPAAAAADRQRRRCWRSALALVGASAIAWVISRAGSGSASRAIAEVAQRYRARRSDAAAARLRRRRARDRWRGRSTIRCRSSDGGSRSSRAIARAWRPSSPA